VIGYERKRICPVQIPSEIKNKLILLMKQLQLESGSIDMIVTPNNEYVFLEVNPVGQFDYVSKLCNYFIEKEIAVKLIEMNKYEN
jgi:glutathione synthase/RimK-type ligase-like ATP-grasp enzyme